MIELAIKAAKAAGEQIRDAQAMLEYIEVEQKSQFDYVSKVDRDSETLIREMVSAAYPDHRFLGEEYGLSNSDYSDSSTPLWIVDPLDGTTNFLRQLPHFAVSIAVQIENKIEHAVVYDIAKDELFHASHGQGCFLNGKRMTQLPERGFEGVLLSTGVPFSGQNLAEIDAFKETMTDFLNRGTSGIRRLGSAALDLAYVAAGRYDGFWEANLQPWDIAAGVLLVQEAGGQVGDFAGNDGYLRSGDIIAAPTGVFSEMVSITSKHYQR